MATCSVTAVIPTYRRSQQLLKALAKILACDPQPDEIILHLDGNDLETANTIQQSEFSQRVIVIANSEQVGPGGGRNLAIALAKHPIVASFDDDSYPIDSDYFARLIRVFDAFPTIAVVGGAIYHQNETIAAANVKAYWSADFVGCGCAYRREAFLQTNGYLQLPLAYGMEEVDLSLRLYQLGWKILYSSWLRIFHDTKLEHHNNPKITAASIANQMLLTYLRYPISLWWLGSLQYFSRIFWLIRHQRLKGIRAGIKVTPQLIWRYRMQRNVIPFRFILSYLKLRRQAREIICTTLET